MKYFLVALIITITLSNVARAEVRINEIAWMGVAGTNGHYGEWLELYNSANTSVGLKGWVLSKGAGTKPLFTLTKTIPAMGYLLIERTTASQPDPVPGMSDESGSFSNSGLSNVGESLVLKDAQGAVIQALDFSSGWPAGDASTKQTMQWNGSSWITGTATPDAQNVNVDETVHTDVPVKTNDASTQSSGSTTTNTTSNTSANTIDTTPTKKAPVKTKKVAVHISFVFPDAVYKGVSYSFSAIPSNDDASYKNIVWNMGDGTVLKQTDTSPVQYAYQNEGTYTVTVAYYGDSDIVVPIAKSTKTVTVTFPHIGLARTDDGELQIKNLGTKQVDMSGWQFVNNALSDASSDTGIIPELTLLASKATITLTPAVLGISEISSGNLTASDGTVIARLITSDFVANDQKDGQKDDLSIAKNSVASSGKKNTKKSFAGKQSVTVRGASFKSKADPLLQNSDGAGDDNSMSVSSSNTSQNQQHRTRIIVFGAAIIVGIGLLLLLERFMASKE